MSHYISSNLVQQPSSQPSSKNEIESVKNISSDDDLQRSIERAKEVDSELKKEHMPPGFILQNDQLMWQPEGVDADGQPKPAIYVCSHLKVLAITRDNKGNNHGRLLELKDADGRVKQWALPMSLLAGDGTHYREELYSMGLLIGSAKNSRSLLSMYIQLVEPEDRITCVPTTGWHDNQFVLPTITFGEKGKERLLLQEHSQINNTYTTKGTLKDWIENVATYCRNNPRLLFATSCSFAGPLLYPFGVENGGFHFYGKSSSGKTTAIRVAASVWGGEKYMESWNSTLNGLASITLLHSDTFLCLDEMAQAALEIAGKAAYLLGNGFEKNRSNQYGGARKKSSWRVLFLSSGEKTLSQYMQSVGQKSQGGQEVRIVDLPSNTGKHGLFDDLHGCANGKELSELLEFSSKQYHGVAAQEFLKKLLLHLEELIGPAKALLQDFIKENLPEDADGQVGRVLNRFGLVGVAGEIATTFGITNWPPGSALKAAAHCFKEWLQTRGGVVSQEETKLLEQVYLFFEQHGESRFTPWIADPAHKTINRAGFRNESEGGMEFYVFTETFKQEICKGFDHTFAAKILVKHGLLMPSTEKNKNTRSERLPGNIKSIRCYRFTSKVLGTSETGENCETT